MNNIAHYCFWVERSLSSWERFLSENIWDVNAVGKTLVNLLLQKLARQLQVHGGYLAGLDTLLVPKNGSKMSGVQQFAISRVLFPKSAQSVDLRAQSPELDQILRLAA